MNTQTKIALAAGIFTLLISLSPTSAEAEGLRLSSSGSPRGSVLSIGVGGAFPTQVEPVALPYVSLAYEYQLPLMRFTVGLRCTVGTEGEHIVGNAMATFGYILPGNFHAGLMLGYANFSQFSSHGRSDPGWAMDGFAWGLNAGWRWWYSNKMFLEPEVYFSHSSMTSHQTGRGGNAGIFTGFGARIGFDL